MLIELCIAAIICIVVPFLIGDLLLHDAPLGKRYIMGIMVSLAIAQIIFLPVARFQQKFTVYYIIYISIIAVICAFSVIRNHKDYRKDMMSTINLSKIKEQLSIWMILSIILIGYQVLRTTCGSFFVYADNVRYIPYTNDLLSEVYSGNGMICIRIIVSPNRLYKNCKEENEYPCVLFII